MESPVIVELVTGGLVESVHRGAFVVADATGHRHAARGDVDRPLPVWPDQPQRSLHAVAVDLSGGTWRSPPTHANGKDGALKQLANAVAGPVILLQGVRNFCAASIPAERLGIALWIDDGAPRAIVAAMASLLRIHVRLPDRADPIINDLLCQRSDAGAVTGRLNLHMEHDSRIRLLQ